MRPGAESQSDKVFSPPRFEPAEGDTDLLYEVSEITVERT
jgi:hypothetical protein